MTNSNVVVRCPECKNEYTYGFVFDSASAVVGSKVAEQECRICGQRVAAMVVRLEESPPVEDNPIRGWTK
jgi:ribosomal protein S27E